MFATNFGAGRLAVARRGMPKFLSSRRKSPVVFDWTHDNRTRYAVDITSGGRNSAISLAVCREIGLLTKASVAIDGSKFKAVNNRDKNFTRAKMERRLAQIEESVARYLSQLDTADLQEPTETLAAKTAHLKEKLAKLVTEMQRLKAIAKEMLASPDQQISLTDPDSRSMATSGRGSGVGYNVQVAVDTSII